MPGLRPRPHRFCCLGARNIFYVTVVLLFSTSGLLYHADTIFISWKPRLLLTLGWVTCIVCCPGLPLCLHNNFVKCDLVILFLWWGVLLWARACFYAQFTPWIDPDIVYVPVCVAERLLCCVTPARAFHPSDESPLPLARPDLWLCWRRTVSEK